MSDKYRHLKIKLTPQRLAILKYLEGNRSHPSAEDIFRAVKKQYPTMSFATVYNTIDALKEKGSIRELKIDPIKKRYDPDLSTHHHMMCVRCNEVFDLFMDVRIDLPEDAIQDFEVQTKSVEITGVCRRCGR